MFAGCSSGQPAAETSPGAAPVPVAAGGEAASGATAVPGAPASTPPATAAPGAAPGTPATTPPEKVKEPEKGDEKEPPPPPERIEVNLESLVAGLQSTAATQVFTAGEYFRQIPKEQRRAVLLELSKHTDPSVRGNAWRVFTTVATKEDLATLSEAMQSPYSDVRFAALETMARFPNDQTIGVLTKLLENPDYREFSAGLLSKIGPACEAAVLPYATHADANIRRAAWDVLVHAGSRKSVQALEQLTTLPQYQKDETLKRSLEQLRERLRKA
ncbi:MAG: HEAT repeat domain-containing protein [Planctomycetales bacterium]|nr:HEAT repeat domain-containing protein [Planctomycetales bacterium]